MRNLKSILVLAFFAIIATSCSKNEEPTVEPVVSKKATNIYAPATSDRSVNPPVESGKFTKFSFKTGTVVTDNSWDIAFRATTILVNGGKKIGLVDEPERTGDGALALETSTFGSILEAPTNNNFKQDAPGAYALLTGSNNGWYSYSGPPTHTISPIAGKVLVIKTNDGHYAKVEILSYYKDSDSSKPANARYYTFNYVYNPNKGDKSLQ
ncbi:HmuY family protein [Polaribacter cellanae]|uniref:HmuY family protein n=1 Tax=Polaribacter cellanae TaxID=2818493 RepID=A0A975CUP0_9FLAO|nr:HmuY family protein [Polaribacter cellanae]QTE23831.1 HmuY family protein [Polaribacter cellanae]